MRLWGRVWSDGILNFRGARYGNKSFKNQLHPGCKHDRPMIPGPHGPRNHVVPLFWALTFLVVFCGCENRHGLRIGETPPMISGRGIRGEHVNLAQMKGKIVIIYFWTKSCCGRSLKQLEPLIERYKDKGVEILAINGLNSRNEVESYARENSLSFTVLADEHSQLFNQYRAVGFPTTFLIDRGGIIREKIQGSIQSTQLEKLIQRQLAIQKQAEASYDKIHPR